MSCVACWLGCLICVSAPAPADGPDPAPAVAVRVAPGPYLVGQGVDVAVTLDPRTPGDEPAVDPPTIARADLFALGAGGAAAATDAGGAVVARFVLVPRQSGTVAVPPFRVRVGGRSLATRRLGLEVAPVPAAGRTPAFGGGVGPARPTSRVEPATVRVGQPVDFEVAIVGPAAWGSLQIPDLAARAPLPAGFEVRGASTLLLPGDPPTRTFRYRLRPMRAGRATLPPIPLATFDPDSRRYLTRFTPSIPLAVEPPPRFDPARVDFGPAARPGPRRLAPGPAGLGVAGAAAVGLVGLMFWQRRARRRAGRAVDWAGEARGIARWAAETPPRNPADLAEAIVGRLAHAVERATGRRTAVLTPPDAATRVEEVAHDAGLAGRARLLVAECDRIRYDLNADATAGDRGELVAEAVAVFLAIGVRARTIPAAASPPDRPDSRDGHRT